MYNMVWLCGHDHPPTFGTVALKGERSLRATVPQLAVTSESFQNKIVNITRAVYKHSEDILALFRYKGDIVIKLNN
jgi:hypothetical protein